MKNDVFVHETAEVSPRAEVGEGTKIWNLVQIRENVAMGNGCILSKNVYIDAGVKIGNRVKIQNNVSVYAGVTIEDDVFVGPSVTFTNDFRPRAVAPNWEVVPTTVRVGASIGANATIVCGVEIGQYAMVAAGSVVTSSIPAHVLVAGNPAKSKGYVYKSGRKVLSTHLREVVDRQGRFVDPDEGEELNLPLDAADFRPKM